MWPVGENELDTPDLEQERHRQTQRQTEKERETLGSHWLMRGRKGGKRVSESLVSEPWRHGKGFWTVRYQGKPCQDEHSQIPGEAMPWCGYERRKIEATHSHVCHDFVQEDPIHQIHKHRELVLWARAQWSKSLHLQRGRREGRQELITKSSAQLWRDGSHLVVSTFSFQEYRHFLLWQPSMQVQYPLSVKDWACKDI